MDGIGQVSASFSRIFYRFASVRRSSMWRRLSYVVVLRIGLYFSLSCDLCDLCDLCDGRPIVCFVLVAGCWFMCDGVGGQLLINLCWLLVYVQ